MNRVSRWALAAVLALAVSACGFHLRGLGAPLKAMPFASLSVDGRGPVYQQVLVDLQRDGRVRVPGKGQTADAVLSLSAPATSKDVLTVNRAGKVNEYQLVLVQHATLTFRDSDAPVPLSVSVRRTMSYSENVVLGKELEEAQLWASMQREAANQLVRRLAYVKPVQAEASAGKGDVAASKP